MSRQLDQYLEPLVSEERFAFYQAVCEFSDDEVGPNMLRWEREHTLSEVAAELWVSLRVVDPPRAWSPDSSC